jgi:hypothetical protein
MEAIRKSLGSRKSSEQERELDHTKRVRQQGAGNAGAPSAARG